MLQVVSTVTTPATSYDLVDLATVKDELGITDASQDSKLKRYITAASAAAAQYCNRVFQLETLQDIIDVQQDAYPWQVPGGADALNLARWPVVTVTSIIEGQSTTPLVAGTDYRLNLSNGQLLRLSPFAGVVTRWEALPITVQYQAGFATIPPDLQDAVIRMIRTRRYADGRDPLVRQQTVPGVLEQQFWVPTGTDAGNMTPDVVDILENYRVPVIG